jgi:hypothetical protein
MKNIFILYMPVGNYEVMVHYKDTIINKVEQKKISKYIDFNLQSKLRNIFSNKSISIWGSRDSKANRAHYEKMKENDDILIVEGDNIKLLGKIAAKTINSELSKELWQNLNKQSIEGWNLIYFIANPIEINLPFNEFKKLFEYNTNWSLRGFTSVSEDKLKEFYNKYDDLYSILIRIKNGDTIEEKSNKIYKDKEEINPYDSVKEDIEDLLDQEKLSEHVTMQWKLIRLGLKTGAKVWIPKNDQSKIIKQFNYNEFENIFASGADVPAKFVENIDVIWKEEFRIDAAFEIENTTSIYSGLLRFSDLKIIAPNSNYPLFIVAPLNKKNRVFEQIKRPTFTKIDFDKKVRYLSYEVLNDIDKFFENNSGGLNIELITNKSELIN